MSEQIATTPAVGFFRVELEVSIEASPEKVFNALTGEVSSWWGAPYLFSEAAKLLTIEPRVGGLCFEDWGEGNGATWGTVTSLKQNELIELTGSIGMSGVVQGVACFELEARDSATVVKLSHHAIGEVTEELQQGYAGGWQDLLGTRLKAFVEQGVKYGIGHEPANAAM